MCSFSLSYTWLTIGSVPKGIAWMFGKGCCRRSHGSKGLEARNAVWQPLLNYMLINAECPIWMLFLHCLHLTNSSQMEKLKPQPIYSIPSWIHTFCPVILQHFPPRGTVFLWGSYFVLCWLLEYHRNDGVSRLSLKRLCMLLFLYLCHENVPSLTSWIMRHMEQSLVLLF